MTVEPSSVAVAITSVLAFTQSKTVAFTTAYAVTFTELAQLALPVEDPMCIISVALTSPDGVV